MIVPQRFRLRGPVAVLFAGTLWLVVLASLLNNVDIGRGAANRLDPFIPSPSTFDGPTSGLSTLRHAVEVSKTHGPLPAPN